MAAMEKTAQIKDLSEMQKSGRLISSMLDTFVRGSALGDDRPRAARLVEELYRLAIEAESESVRLAAAKEIMDRLDGKVVERKEIRSMKVEGIVYLPSVEIASADIIPTKSTI